MHFPLRKKKVGRELWIFPRRTVLRSVTGSITCRIASTCKPFAGDQRMSCGGQYWKSRFPSMESWGARNSAKMASRYSSTRRRSASTASLWRANPRRINCDWLSTPMASASEGWSVTTLPLAASREAPFGLAEPRSRKRRRMRFIAPSGFCALVWVTACLLQSECADRARATADRSPACR